MDIVGILGELKAERGRLDRAIRALDGAARRIGRPRGPRATASSAPQRRRRRMSPDARKRIAAAMKRRWAARKKAGKKSLAN